MKIREAKREDAAAIGAMLEEFCAFLKSIGDDTKFKCNADTFLRDGFGKNPAFQGLVADNNGEAIGYLLYHFGYYTDEAMRIMQIVDLYVRPEYRRQGIGKDLMESASNICIKVGGKRLFWSVYTPNKNALAFYKQIGAQRTKDLEFMYLSI
jgi:GNAT superfamily N-acetyltransferase